MNNTKTMTRTQLETHYRVMIKRVAKNLSAEKLSFLIGRKADYVSHVEMLDTDPYSMEDLQCIATVLEEEDFDNLSPLVDDESSVVVHMSKSIEGDKCNYQCAVIHPNHQDETYFSLQENTAESILIIGK